MKLYKYDLRNEQLMVNHLWFFNCFIIQVLYLEMVKYNKTQWSNHNLANPAQSQARGLSGSRVSQCCCVSSVGVFTLMFTQKTKDILEIYPPKYSTTSRFWSPYDATSMRMSSAWYNLAWLTKTRRLYVCICQNSYSMWRFSHFSFTKWAPVFENPWRCSDGSKPMTKSGANKNH